MPSSTPPHRARLARPLSVPPAAQAPHPLRLLAAHAVRLARIESAAGAALFETVAAPCLTALAADAAALPASRPEGAGGPGVPTAGETVGRGVELMMRLVEAAAAMTPTPGLNPAQQEALRTERRAAAILRAALAAVGPMAALTVTARTSAADARGSTAREVWRPEREPPAAFALRARAAGLELSAAPEADAADPGLAAPRAFPDARTAALFERLVLAVETECRALALRSGAASGPQCDGDGTPRRIAAISDPVLEDLRGVALGLPPATALCRTLEARLMECTARRLDLRYPEDLVRAACSAEGEAFFESLFLALIRRGVFECVDREALEADRSRRGRRGGRGRIGTRPRRPRLWRALDGFWLEWPAGARPLTAVLRTLTRRPDDAALENFAHDPSAGSEAAERTAEIFLLARVFDRGGAVPLSTAAGEPAAPEATGSQAVEGEGTEAEGDAARDGGEAAHGEDGADGASRDARGLPLLGMPVRFTRRLEAAHTVAVLRERAAGASPAEAVLERRRETALRALTGKSGRDAATEGVAPRTDSAGFEGSLSDLRRIRAAEARREAELRRERLHRAETVLPIAERLGLAPRDLGSVQGDGGEVLVSRFEPSPKSGIAPEETTGAWTLTRPVTAEGSLGDRAVAEAIARLNARGQADRALSAEPLGVFLPEALFATGSFEAVAALLADAPGVVRRRGGRFARAVRQRVSPLGEIEAGILIDVKHLGYRRRGAAGDAEGRLPEGRPMRWL